MCKASVIAFEVAPKLTDDKLQTMPHMSDTHVSDAVDNMKVQW